MDTCCLCTRPQGPFSANAKLSTSYLRLMKLARFLFPVKQKQNEFNMQSDGALMKKHIKNISRNDVSAVHKAYGLCNGNSSCELIKLHVFKSDSCTLNLSSQIPYGIFLL